jgi:hypothetical protein
MTTDIYPENQVTISGGGWEKFRRVMLQAKQIANVASDNVVGNVGAEGRRAATAVEEKKFKLGVTQTKGSKTGVFSQYDSQLGGWRGTQGRKLRMIGFSWENVRSNKNARNFSRSLSSAYAYSLLSNLFENDTKPYSASSPWFMRAGEGKFGIWGKGSIRSGKHYIDRLRNAYQSSIPTAIDRTEKKIQEIINRDVQ